MACCCGAPPRAPTSVLHCSSPGGSPQLLSSSLVPALLPNLTGSLRSRRQAARRRWRRCAAPSTETAWLASSAAAVTVSRRGSRPSMRPRCSMRGQRCPSRRWRAARTPSPARAAPTSEAVRGAEIAPQHPLSRYRRRHPLASCTSRQPTAHALDSRPLLSTPPPLLRCATGRLIGMAVWPCHHG